MKARNKYLIGFFLLIISLTLLAIYSVPDSRLHLIACDVGQGDAILTGWMLYTHSYSKLSSLI